MSNKFILATGGINTDFVIKAERVPRPGETLLGSGFSIVPGGKGANQAVAIARLGGKAILGGCVGKDSLGQRLKEGLGEEGVVVNYVAEDENQHSGVTMIIINKQGDNSIILDAGANMRFTPHQAGCLKNILSEVNILLANLEIPIETIDFLFKEAKKFSTTTILDAGPAKPLPSSVLQNTDILSPNQTELESLVEDRIKDMDDAKKKAEKLLAWRMKAVILKLGEKGSYLLTAKHKLYFPPYKVKAADTTAAGDAFMGALCVKLSQGEPLPEAVRFANLAGASAVMKMGAQPSLPTTEDIQKLKEKFLH